jgi:hypothetical protein
MPAGQPVFDTQTTGGWYQGFDGLRAQLIELGLPNRTPLSQTPPKATPTPAPATPQPAPATAWPRLAVLAAGLLLITTGAVLTLRRHAGKATAAH